jgi:carbamoyl-phosphate synthase large subunit
MAARRRSSSPRRCTRRASRSSAPVRRGIDIAEDRERFQQLLKGLGLKQPENGIARDLDEAVREAERIGYPVVVRPSYVLGGRAMEICHNREQLRRFGAVAVQVSGDNPILIDQYLADAIEVDVDCIADANGEVYVAGVMEHIEEAGIHSGDSACSLPPYSLAPALVTELKAETEAMAKALKVKGLMNVQYAVKDGEVFVLEVNPRASRTVPFVAKATGVPVAKIGARVMAGARLSEFGLDDSAVSRHVAVKEAVFPFNRFPNVDVILGPEMKSTGEVMGLDLSFERAFLKSQLGAGVKLPEAGAAFISVKDADKAGAVTLARRLSEMGFKVIATRGTAAKIREAGLDCAVINKVAEGRPHCVDAIKSDAIQLVINTTGGGQSCRTASTSAAAP